MYALIIYLEDDIYQVCLESTLKLKRNVVMGKFLGKYYPARIVTRSGINFQIKYCITGMLCNILIFR